MNQAKEPTEPLRAITELLDAMETCHVCQGVLALDDIEPAHCEDCSGDCEDHDEPNCRPFNVLFDAARRAVATLAHMQQPAPEQPQITYPYQPVVGDDGREYQITTTTGPAPEQPGAEPSLEARKAAAFDWLEKRGFSTCGTSTPSSPSVHCWGDEGRWTWTCQWHSSELPAALTAVECAMRAESEAPRG